MPIYVKDADGNRKKVAGAGLPGPAGKSAYQYAVEGGFSGTEDEFRALMGVKSNPSLLDNAYWAKKDCVINQKGQEEYAAESYSHIYTIDRLSIYGPGITLAIEDGDIVLRNQSTEQGGMTEQLELSRFYGLLGETVSLSILYKLTGGADLCQWQQWSNDGAQTNYEPLFKTIPESSDWDVLTTAGEVEAAGTGSIENYGGLFIHIEAGSELRLKAAKLELGSVQTLAHKEGDAWVLNDPPPDKALELAKCQRYMYVMHTSSGYAISTTISDSNGDASFPIITPVVMRALPALTTSGNVRTHGASITYNAVKSFSGVKLMGNIASLHVTGLRSLAPYTLDTAPDGYIILDANL